MILRFNQNSRKPPTPRYKCHDRKRLKYIRRIRTRLVCIYIINYINIIPPTTGPFVDNIFRRRTSPETDGRCARNYTRISKWRKRRWPHWTCYIDEGQCILLTLFFFRPNVVIGAARILAPVISYSVI